MKRLIIISIFSLFIFSCGEKTREEIIERYDNGKMKTIMRFIGEGSEEVMIEKLVYSQSGDTLVLENYNSKGEKDDYWVYYSQNYLVKGNYKDGKKDGKWTWYEENGQIWKEENYKDGKEDGKRTYYKTDGSLIGEGIYKNGYNHQHRFVLFLYSVQLLSIVLF